MKDLVSLAGSIRIWGYVALAFSLLPATELADRLERGVYVWVPHAGVPLLVLAGLGLAMVLVGFALERGLVRSDREHANGRLERVSRHPGRLVFGVTALMVLFYGLANSLCACSTRVYGWEAAMRSDLRNIQSAQEIHWAEHESYTASLEALNYYPTDGVSIEIRATERTWTGRATHIGLAEVDGSCVVFVGEIEPFPTLTGREVREPGEIYCHPDY